MGISFLTALFLIFAFGISLWIAEPQLAFGPSPTPTGTQRPPPTGTPDFRATQVAEDLMTQEAIRIASSGSPLPPSSTPTPGGSEVHLPVVSSGGTPTPSAPSPVATLPEIAGETPAPTETPTQSTVALPVIGNEPFTRTPTPTATGSEPEVPVEVPPEATSTEEPLPTSTPTLALPTETPTLEPPTPSPTPSPTDLPYIVSSLRAFIDTGGRNLRVGPGNIYTATENSFASGTEVRLLGRNPSGEWVYACCLDDEPGWIRQAYAQPANNELGPGAPLNARPNDVRWLNVQPVSSALRPPMPAPTEIPQGDFPLYRYDRGGRGFVPTVPQPPVTFAWPSIAQAAGPLISPVTVVGPSVVVASADNHLYAFDRVNGNQRWRFNLGQRVTVAPLALDGRIYVADEVTRIFALIDNGNEAVEDWRNTLVLPAISSFNVHSDTLFIAVGREEDHRMLALDRTNGNTIRSLSTSGSGLRYPIVGDQLVYVADGQLIAWDVFSEEQVWTRADINNIPAPPVYARNGISSVAELYVADVANRLYSLDANTGDTNWSLDTGEPISGLALNASIVFASGNGYVRAVSRVSGEELWRAAVAGPVLAGPLVDNERVMITTAGGNVQFLNASTGNVLNSAVIPAQAGGPAAISAPWIYAPGANGGIYALRSSQ